MNRHFFGLSTAILFAVTSIGIAQAPNESAIAKFALVLGNNRLAQQADDEKGRVLILFAAELEPDNQDVKNAVNALDEKVPLKPIPTTMTMDRLAGAMGQRAGYLLQQKDPASRQRALLYLHVLAIFSPDNEKISAAIAELEGQGIQANLPFVAGAKKAPPKDVAAANDKIAPEAGPAVAPEPPPEGGFDEHGNPLPRPKADYTKIQAPAEWIKFAKARDQKDLNEQVDLLAKQYAKLCPAASYKTKSGLQVRGVPPIVQSAQGTPDQILNMDLDGRGTLNTLSPLLGMPLETLTIIRPRGPTLDVEPLHASRLTILRIVRAEELREIKNLDKLQLQALELVQCPELSSLDFLKGANLKVLNFVDCARLQDLNALSDLKLTGLGFTNCPAITSLRPLGGMPLEKVKLVDCPNIRDINPLEKLPITDLTVHNCKNLSDRNLLFSIKQMGSLQNLDAAESIMKRVELKK